MTLAKAGAATSPFVFEDDIVAALANREIEAAAITPMTVGWFNLQHADKPLRLIPAFDNDQDLNWNIAAGLLRPETSCNSVSMRRSRRCWQMAPSRGSMPATASSCDLRSEARYRLSAIDTSGSARRALFAASALFALSIVACAAFLTCMRRVTG